MARPKKSKGSELKHVYDRDKTFFETISNTGVVTPGNYENAGVSSSRIKAYAKAGLIEKTPKQDGGAFGYKLTNEGKNFMEKTWGMERSDNYNHQSLNHDRKLEEQYHKVDKEKYEWRNESQVREMFQEKIEQIREQDPARADRLEEMQRNKEISMPDAVIINRTTQTMIAIEVITNSYGQEEMQAKETFCEVMEVEYRPVRA